jgi:hypothetical protein
MRFEANTYHAAHQKARQHINKFFHEIKVGNIDRTKQLECFHSEG